MCLQVLWQPGWTPGCAKTLGEEGEQFFSYLSQWAFTTRNQSVAGEAFAVLQLPLFNSGTSGVAPDGIEYHP